MAFLLVMSVLSVAPSSVLAQQQPVEETEPNDAPRGGTPVLGDHINGTLSPAGADSDWYVIKVEKGETIEATVNFGTVGNADFQVSLVSPNGTQLDQTEGAEKQLGVAAIAPQTGLYYIGISSFYYTGVEASPSTIPYTLTVSPVMNTTPASFTESPDLSQQPRPETEPNDFQGNATRVRKAPISGTIQSTKDGDWYAIHANAGERIEAIAVFETVDNNTYLRVHMRGPRRGYVSPYGEFIQTDRRIEIATIAQETGMYYVKISANYAPPNTNYTLTMFSVGEGQTNDTGATQPPTTTATGVSLPPLTPTITAVDPSTINHPIDYPPGYSASGIPNPKRAFNQYRTTLAASNNYTVTTNITRYTPGTLVRSNTTKRIDLAHNRAFIYSSSLVASQEYITKKYNNGSVIYVLSSAFSGASVSRYDAGASPFKTFYVRKRPTVGALLADVHYGQAKIVKRNDGMLIRYKATNITSSAPFNLYLNSTKNISNYTLALSVNQNGLIRSVTYSVTYTNEDGNHVTKWYRRRITAVNETAVKKPNWLDEAKANTTVQIPATTTGRATQTQAGTASSNESTGPSETTTMIPTNTSTNGASGSNRNSSNRSDDNTATESSSSGPGFGLVVAVVALLAAALLAVRRD